MALGVGKGQNFISALEIIQWKALNERSVLKPPGGARWRKCENCIFLTTPTSNKNFRALRQFLNIRVFFSDYQGPFLLIDQWNFLFLKFEKPQI